MYELLLCFIHSFFFCGSLRVFNTVPTEKYPVRAKSWLPNQPPSNLSDRSYTVVDIPKSCESLVSNLVSAFSHRTAVSSVLSNLRVYLVNWCRASQTSAQRVYYGDWRLLSGPRTVFLWASGHTHHLHVRTAYYARMTPLQLEVTEQRVHYLITRKTLHDSKKQLSLLLLVSGPVCRCHHHNIL